MYVYPNQNCIIAHSFLAENTLLSFLTAAQFGVEYVEFDVQMTKDKVPVIHHDFMVCAVDEGNGEIRTPISCLTKKEFKLLHPDRYDLAEVLGVRWLLKCS